MSFGWVFKQQFNSKTSQICVFFVFCLNSIKQTKYAFLFFERCRFGSSGHKEMASQWGYHFASVLGFIACIAFNMYAMFTHCFFLCPLCAKLIFTGFCIRYSFMLLTVPMWFNKCNCLQSRGLGFVFLCPMPSRQDVYWCW